MDCLKKIPVAASILILSAIYSFGSLCGISSAHGAPVPVYLTFDVEMLEDIKHLDRLRINVPATYFVLGNLADKNPAEVKRLAQNGNSIGSHSYSHPDLTKLSPSELTGEIRKGKTALEKAVGRPVLWFRAPYLTTSKEVSRALKEAGFRYESSESRRWARTFDLPVLPISVGGPDFRLASDFDLFVKHGLSKGQVLKWMKDRFEERIPSGRPLVLLLHPHLIRTKGGNVLPDFIRYVRKAGGTFETVDGYTAKVFRPASNPKRGIWVDFSLGLHNPEAIVQDVVKGGFTDVYLMVKSPGGNRYFPESILKRGKVEINESFKKILRFWLPDFAEAPEDDGGNLFGKSLRLLKAKGIRVHAWVPVFKDAYLAQKYPQWAVADLSGARSKKWLSPIRPHVQAYYRNLIAGIIEKYPVDGIHLDYVRYPGFDYDYSPRTIGAFEAETGAKNNDSKELLNKQYSEWVNWRAAKVAEFVGEIRRTVKSTNRPNVVLSASLIAEAAINFDSRDNYGQDFADISRSLDMVIPMAYFKDEGNPVSWISNVVFSSHYHIGSRKLMVGISTYQKPGKWNYRLNELQEAIRLGQIGSDGVAFYPYLWLFGKGEDGWNMPERSVDVLTKDTNYLAAEKNKIISLKK